MHDIKFIKKNPLLLDNSLKKRKLPPCSFKILKIHNEYLEQLNQKQKLLEEKNSLSKSFLNKKKNVEEIKKLKSEGLGATAIAKKLNIHRDSVYRLLKK